MDMPNILMTDINLTRWVLGTAILVLLLGGFALLLAKLRQDKSDGLPKRLRRLETLALTPRHQLHVIQHSGQEHLILTGPQGDTLIHTADSPKTTS